MFTSKSIATVLEVLVLQIPKVAKANGIRVREDITERSGKGSKPDPGDLGEGELPFIVSLAQEAEA